MQAAQTLLPSCQFGIAQHGVLNDLIALVFGVQVADHNVGLRGANEILQRGIDECGLRVYVEERRSSAFETERKTIRPADSGSSISCGM